MLRNLAYRVLPFLLNSLDYRFERHISSVELNKWKFVKHLNNFGSIVGGGCTPNKCYISWGLGTRLDFPEVFSTSMLLHIYWYIFVENIVYWFKGLNYRFSNQTISGYDIGHLQFGPSAEGSIYYDVLKYL